MGASAKCRMDGGTYGSLTGTVSDCNSLVGGNIVHAMQIKPFLVGRKHRQIAKNSSNREPLHLIKKSAF
jgi:hypothetical protein